MASKFNKTRLIPDYQRQIHRDYIAHCLRWDYVVQRYSASIKRPDNKFKILDVGCGEAHLMKTLWACRLKPELYLGVDVDKAALIKAINKNQPKNFKAEYMFADFTRYSHGEAITKTYGKFDAVVCFEVLEHLPNLDYAEKMLKNIRYTLKKGGEALISTPTRFKNDDKVSCKNHLFEYTQEDFLKAVKRNFKIKKVYGTMMYLRKFNKWYKDYQKQAMYAKYEGIIKTFDILLEYYDSNVLSAFLGPAFPELSRSQMIVAVKL